jgi:molybdenum cofactor cytidylyltransferase
MTDPSADATGNDGVDDPEPTERDTTGNATSEPTEDLPVIDPAALTTASHTREGPIVGILLAAGTSSRFGPANKLLATVEGDPLVRRAARTLCASAVDRTVVVLGHDADRIQEELAGLDVECQRNDAYDRGQSTSVREGVRAAREGEASAAVIALADLPAVSPSTIDALVAAYRADAGTALAAAFEGQRGNPVLFDERYFEALEDVSGDVGGHELLLDGERAALVETGDPGVLRDVDTEADLDEYSQSQ